MGGWTLEGASVSQACPWQSVAAVATVAVVTAVAVVAAAVKGVLACGGWSVCSSVVFAYRLCPQPCHLMQLAPMPVA